MIAGLLALAAAQAFVPPPAPPLPPVDGPRLAEESRRYADRLRAQCLSDAGVVAAVESFVAGRRDGVARSPDVDAANRALADAVYAPRVDPDRIAAALERSAAVQARAQASRDARSVALLRQLSPADRAIYARQLTIMQPLLPAKTCGLPPR